MLQHLTRLLLVAACLFAAAQGADSSMAVIVLPFETGGVPKHWGDALADETGRILGQYPGVSLVNRAKLMAILDEQKLSLSGLTEVSPQDMGIGRMAGATHFVTGRISKLEDLTVVSLRCIEVATEKETALVSRKGSYSIEKSLSFLNPMVDEMIDALAAQRRTAPRTDAAAGSSVNRAFVPAGFAFIDGRRFTMGAGPDAHAVTVRPFYIKKTEVTNAEYAAFCAESGREFNAKGLPGLPVTDISWEEAKAYCEWYSGKNNCAARLPYECEWECAYSAGMPAKKPALRDYVSSIAWHAGNSGGALHPVGTKEKDANGLFDMLGNAEEWCMDWYDDNYYAQSPGIQPKGPENGEYRVTRGGNAFSPIEELLPTRRGSQFPDYGFNRVGFRVVIEAR
jgi:formylglycine-generating enzyme required for sulfatase activity